jgi:hypothetical protein
MATLPKRRHPMGKNDPMSPMSPASPIATHRVASLILSLTMLASASLFSIGVATPARAATTKSYTFKQLVDTVPVTPPLYVGYRGPTQFIPDTTRLKKDAKGCNLRQRMIISLAQVKPKVGARCRMKGGTWVTALGATVKTARGLNIAPIMSYKQAWGQGAYAWTPAQRLAWATNTSTAPTKTRAKGVTPLQITQKLYTDTELDVLLLATTAASAESDRLRELIAFCNRDIGCLIYVSSAFQTLSAFGQSDLQSGVDACNGVVARLTNIAAWGLSMNPEEFADLTRSTDPCSSNSLYTVEDFAALNRIAAAVQPAVVPQASSTGSTGSTTAGGLTLPFTGYAAPVTEPVRASLFGLTAPVDWVSPQVPTGSLRLWDVGVSWKEIETSQGVYDWSKLSATVQRAADLGAGVMYVLGNTPAWANGGKGDSAPPSNIEDAARFLKAICTKFGGAISSYEVWNEGNISRYWSGTQQQLAELTYKANLAIKGCPGSAQVVAASTGVRASGTFATQYTQYLEALKEKNWPVDAFSVHSYPLPNGTPKTRLDLVAQFKTMLAVNGAPADREILDTELNYGLASSSEGRVPLSDSTTAAYISQSFIQSVQYGIDSTYWYLWTGSDYALLGGQLNPGTPAAKRGWSTTYSWLVGSRMQRCGTAGPSGSVQICQLTGADGENYSLLWSTGPAAKVDASGIGSTLCRLDGTCAAIATPASVDVTESPIRIGGLWASPGGA